MDRKAYEKVKQHITETLRKRDVTDPPMPETNIREWQQARMLARQRLIEEEQRLAQEPKRWSNQEQDALGEIATSGTEPREDRMKAIALMHYWKLTHHANLLAGLLQDPQTDSSVRYVAAWHLGHFGRKEMLPLIYDVAMSARVPPERYFAGLYDVCVQAMLFIASDHGLVDKQKYDLSQGGHVNALCRRWWEETKPTREMILAWSRDEPA